MMKERKFEDRQHSIISYTLRVVLSCLFVFSQGGVVFATPEGAEVINGNVSITQSGATTAIHASDNSIINYQSFDIHSNETVQFIQPDSSSRVLNRITGAFPTQIDGSLLANGHVYISNPAGIYIGAGAFIDVGKLTAAVGTITNEDFLNNIDHITDVSGDVINWGTVEADLVQLIGKEVINHGVIRAESGLISLVAGDDVLLGERDGHIFVKIKNAAAAANPEGNADSVDDSGRDDGSHVNDTVSLGAGDMYSLAIQNTGTLQAKEVVLEGSDASQVQVSGTIDASHTSPEGVGGSIKVLGDDIKLVGADIEASGSNEGGTVLIGGDFQGKGDARTASRTTIDSDTTINVDAHINGDGGKAIVWSEDETRFSGQISARGGSKGGNGGLIETSGKQYLAVSGGQVDASAPQGSSGAWLLDPRNVTIQDAATMGGTFDGSNPNTFTPTVDEATVARDVIQNSLNGGTDVTITTGASGNVDGNVTVVDTITKSSGVAATLTLNAANDIIVNAAVSSAAGALGITFNAGNDVDINASVNTNGGAFVATGINFDNTGGAITTANGAVNITQNGSVLAGAEINSGTGDITINVGGANSASSNRLANIISSGNVIVTGGAGNDVFLVADGAVLPGVINGAAGIDTLDFSEYTTARQTTLTGLGATDGFSGTDTAVTGGFDGIDTIIGGIGDDTLTGINANASWNIDGTNQYLSTNTLDFSGIENLTGGTADDRFELMDGGSISGTLDGGGQTTADEYDVAAITAPISIALSDLANVEAVVGDGTNDTLVGRDTGEVWQITGANSGSVDVTDFTGFSNLSGGIGDDIFNLSGGNLTGNLNGGEGNDILVGDNVSNAFEINGVNAGTATGIEGGINAIENFTGGTAEDSFVLVNDGRLDGTISGGDGVDTVQVIGAASSSIGGRVHDSRKWSTVRGRTH